jgi:hypothetical protein
MSRRSVVPDQFTFFIGNIFKFRVEVKKMIGVLQKITRLASGIDIAFDPALPLTA